MTDTPNPSPRGGSYLNDDATGLVVPIFIPDAGMDPDATIDDALARAAEPQPDPETPADEPPAMDDAANEENP